MTKYTKEETLILRRCKVKDVYSYLKEAILHFTIPEIELAIKMMENRLKFERNPERRDVYSSILIGIIHNSLKADRYVDIDILRSNQPLRRSPVFQKKN